MAEKKPGKEELSFEDSMKRLGEIVAALETGDVSLDDSMAMFAEGTALIGRCTAMLNEAEQQVVRLKKGEDGAPEELPFEA
jgi:exodeoxyribonuclease VII small subunit